MENDRNKKTEFEDIYSDSKKRPTYKKGYKPLEERDVYYPNKFFEFMLKNNKRNTKIILVVLIVLVLGLTAFAVYSIYFNKMLDESESWQGDENYTEDLSDNQFDAMGGITDASSLDDLLEKWYSNGGEIMDQKYVVNILLLGIDGKNGVKNGGNSDSMILASVNKKTKKITLVSFMRDSRAYYEANGKGYVAKANSAFGRGGAKATVNMIEKNYKIDIDYYVAVDFTTFTDLVDALGGVTLDIQEYEQKYINRTTTKINKIPNYGTVTLDGEQALVYCRIRKSDADSDVSRTRRQRNFISALITSAKGATLSQLNDAVDAVLPHLATDCSKTKVLDFARQALTQGWMNYEIVQVTMPDEETRKDANIGGVSYWVVDYTLAAYKVQMAVYGTSNINIDDNRDSALDYVYYNQSSSSDENQTGSNDIQPEEEETSSTRPDFTWPWENEDSTNTDDESTTTDEEVTQDETSTADSGAEEESDPPDSEEDSVSSAA